jgi:hypothetical protein
MSQKRKQFEKLVDGLVKSTNEFAGRHDWVTKVYPKKFRGVDGQAFEVPALFLQKGPVRILLDPIAFDVPGSEAVVDLYLMPAYDDLATLFFENGGWTIHYAFPPNPLETHSVVETKILQFDETTFSEVLDSIAQHAEQSI